MFNVSQAAFGLAGVVVGGAITATGTFWAHRLQLKATISAEQRLREITASSTIIGTLVSLLQIDEVTNGGVAPGNPSSRLDQSRQQLLLVLVTCAQDLRPADLRDRIDQAHRVLSFYAAVWNMLGREEAHSRHVACLHAMECVGAFRREEPLPPRPVGFAELVDAINEWTSGADRRTVG